MQAVGRVSGAARGLCMWVRAICVHGGIACDIAPRRARLAGAQTALVAKKTALSEAQSALAGALSAVAVLQVSSLSTVTGWHASPCYMRYSTYWTLGVACGTRPVPSTFSTSTLDALVKVMEPQQSAVRRMSGESELAFCYRLSMRAR